MNRVAITRRPSPQGNSPVPSPIQIFFCKDMCLAKNPSCRASVRPFGPCAQRGSRKPPLEFRRIRAGVFAHIPLALEGLQAFQASLRTPLAGKGFGVLFREPQILFRQLHFFHLDFRGLGAPPPRVASSFSTSSRCSAVRFRGMTTLTVTNWSPRPEERK